MKKTVLMALTLAVFAGVPMALFAGGPTVNTNQSAEYCKVLHRIASTDPDAAYFNPAGTAFMRDGLYLYLSNQTVYMPMQIRVRGGDANVYAGVSRGKYNILKYAWYFPSAYMVYRKGGWAWSIAGMPIGGGGNGEYKNGLQMIDALLGRSAAGLGTLVNQLYNRVGIPGNVINGPVLSRFSGSSTVYGVQTSVAYAFLEEKVSVSLGYRYMLGDQTYDAKLLSIGGAYGGILPLGSDFHARQTGMAHGIILGVSVRPVEGLTMGLRGEWNGPLRLTAKSHDALIVGMVDSGFMNGGKTHMQLPAIFNAGLSYRIEGVQISCSFIYYFNQFAQMKGKEKGYTGGIDTGIGIDYTFRKVPLNIGAGYLYNESGARPSARSQMSEELDSHNVGFGISYKFNDDIMLTIALGYAYAAPANVNRGQANGLRLLPVLMHKEAYLAAIGLTCKVL
jgi:hypothetical protein